MSETSIVSARLHEAAYFRMSWTFALPDGSARKISLHIYVLSCCLDNGFFVFGWSKSFVASTFLVWCRYCFREFTGQRLPTVPSASLRGLTVLWFHLFLVDSFLARKEGWGLISRVSRDANPVSHFGVMKIPKIVIFNKK